MGKTTTAVNIAASMALHGLRVLVIDLDPQGNASTALDVEHHSGTMSIYNVLVDGQPLSGVVKPAASIPQLYCAPATIDLAGAEIELVPMVARESRLVRALAGFDSSGFDYIFIDCPPSLGLLTVNALVAAPEVLIPIQCEYYALEGLEQLLRTVDLVKSHLNPGLTVSTILLTMFDGRTRLASQVADEVREHFGEHRAVVDHPAQRPGLRGPELRAVRDDLRSGVERGAGVPRGGAGDGAPQGAVGLISDRAAHRHSSARPGCSRPGGAGASRALADDVCFPAGAWQDGCDGIRRPGVHDAADWRGSHARSDSEERQCRSRGADWARDSGR